MCLSVNSAGRAESSALPEATQAVLAGPKNFVVKQQVITAYSDRLLIRVDGCGVCASSLPVWQGRPWFIYPRADGVPGHEGWGEIVGIGDGLNRSNLSSQLDCGQKVTFLCDTAFASYVAVAPENIVPLPPVLHDRPFPGEAVGCAMNIFRRADMSAGQWVAVIGAGFLGLLLVQLAVAAGSRVVVLTRRPMGRELAKKFGALECFDTDDWWGNGQKVMALTKGRGCERVIEATGLQFALELSTQIIAEYGRLVIAGYHQDGLRQVNMQQWNWRAIDVINAHERDPKRCVQGIVDGIDAVQTGRIDLDALLTHRFSLAGLNDAFRMLEERPEGFIKGWVQL